MKYDFLAMVLNLSSLSDVHNEDLNRQIAMHYSTKNVQLPVRVGPLKNWGMLHEFAACQVLRPLRNLRLWRHLNLEVLQASYNWTSLKLGRIIYF